MKKLYRILIGAMLPAALLSVTSCAKPAPHQITENQTQEQIEGDPFDLPEVTPRLPHLPPRSKRQKKAHPHTQSDNRLNERKNKSRPSKNGKEKPLPIKKKNKGKQHLPKLLPMPPKEPIRLPITPNP